MKVSEVMTVDPIMISPDNTITEAAQKMRDEDCGVLPVGSQEDLVGMITDRDITIWVTAEEKDPYKARVSEVMSYGIITCNESDSLEQAADSMSINGVRRLVVKNEEGKVTGIVSIADLMKNIGDEKITDDVMHHVLKYA